MNLLAQSAFLKALGWALLHSLWQMGVLWLLYSMLTANGKRFESRQRYNLALLFVSIGTVAFLATLATEFSDLNDPVVVYAPAGIADAPSIFEQMASFLEPALPALSSVYLFVIALLFIRFFRQYYFSQKLVQSATQKANPELRLFLAEMAQQFGIRKKIRLGLSDLVNTPLTLGFWKPVILLPVAAINHLNIKQTEAIILHELNHIKQNDYLVNLLIACLDIVLFFNPFSRLLTNILIKERENSCDDLVLQYRYPASEYATALLLLEQSRLSSMPILAIPATGNNKKLLLNRVQRILYGKALPGSVNYRMLAFLVSALLIAITGFYNPAKIITRRLSNELPQVTVTPFSAEMNRDLVSVPENSTATPDREALMLRNLEPTRAAKPDTEEAEEEYNDEDEFFDPLIRTVNMPVQGTMTGQSGLYSFTTNAQVTNYSIQESTAPVPVAASYEVEGLPYVPATSFSYHFVEDTTYPKRYVATASEVKAKEDLEKALKALEEIDWEKLEKELGENATNIDIPKLQAQLKKALEELNWKKINDDVVTGRKLNEHEVLARQAYVAQLQKFRKDKLQAEQTEQQVRQAIVSDRLNQNEALKKCEDDKKKTAAKAKKIVII